MDTRTEFGKGDHDLLIEIAATLRDMRSRLFGNGQPGELQVMQKRLAEAEGQIRRLNSYKWLLGGALAVVAFLLGAYGHAVIRELAHL